MGEPVERQPKPRPQYGPSPAPSGDAVGPTRGDAIRQQQRGKSFEEGDKLTRPGCEADARTGLGQEQPQCMEDTPDEAAQRRARPWHMYPTVEAPNLTGNPPVRSRDEPPNKEVREDGARFAQKRGEADKLLASQRDRAATYLSNGIVTDNRYWFAKVYTFTTEGELMYADSGSFYYPGHVMECVTGFERLYADNIVLADRNLPVEESWKEAFRVAAAGLKIPTSGDIPTQDKLVAMASTMAANSPVLFDAARALVASMLAHIRYDLPRAEVWAFERVRAGNPDIKIEDFRADFLTMAGIFDRSGKMMMDDIADRVGIPVGWAPTELQDWFLQNSFGPDMEEERATTWERTEALAKSGHSTKDPYRGGPAVEGNTHMGGLDKLGALKPTMDKATHDANQDDEVRAQVERDGPAKLARRPLLERIKMIRRLVVDSTVDDDEAAMLTIIRASKNAGDLAALLDGSDVYEVRLQFQGAELTEFDKILHETSYFAVTSVGNAAYFIRRCAQEGTDDPQESWIMQILLMRTGQWAIFELLGERKIPQGVAIIESELEEQQWEAVWVAWQMASRSNLSRFSP